VLALTDWLREHNAGQSASDQVGFYGLDLYSLYTSIAEVLRYLDRIDPAAARTARERYACFERYDDDSQAYAYAASMGMSASCESGAVAQLRQLQQHAADYMNSGIASADDAYFYAQQNAQLVKDAEAYYRTMFHGRVASWNLRDRHMADTLDALALHLERQRGRPARIAVWAHNSHLGDARATETSHLGEWNLGQLSRERHPGASFLLGFTTYQGSVTAATRWDGAPETKSLVPALPGSVEALLHAAAPDKVYLSLAPGNSATAALAERRLQRAIGVLYLPKTERQSHYFFSSTARQFDALVHIDSSSALVPLEPVAPPSGDQAETYPSGV
jgi:erythromycin esterase-like protein